MKLRLAVILIASGAALSLPPRRHALRLAIGGSLPGGRGRVNTRAADFISPTLRGASILLQLQTVVYILNSVNRINNIFRQPFRAPVGYSSRQRDLMVLDLDIDIASVELPMLRETVADLFIDPLVRARVVARSFARVRTGAVPISGKRNNREKPFALIGRIR